MKKFLIALVLGLLFIAALATVASADNGPHGGFTATTDACAGCHRAHTAQYGSNSLLIADPEALCLSCHDGTGAGTNVEHGVYSQAGSDAYTGVAGSVVEGVDNGSLFGGGFAEAKMAHSWSGKATADATYNGVSQATTSAHNVGTTGTVWGSGVNGSGTGGGMVLECTSCHDPHGTAGWVSDGNAANGTDTRVASYRLLRWQPQGSSGFEATPATSVNWSGGAFPISDMGTIGGTDTSGWLVPDNFTTNGQEWYTLGTTSAFATGDYMAGSTNNVYNIKHPSAPAGSSYIPAAVNTAFFCAQCHDRYFNNSKLRNDTDASVYCGAPIAGQTSNGVALPVYADADGAAPWIHPADPVRCEPVFTATGALDTTKWGDNGTSGDALYMYRHASGDIRISMDGTSAAGAGTSVSRSCVACHVAHGTTAASTALASSATLAGDSALLRLDNRSVCLRCHASSVNFTVGP